MIRGEENSQAHKLLLLQGNLCTHKEKQNMKKRVEQNVDLLAGLQLYLYCNFDGFSVNRRKTLLNSRYGGILRLLISCDSNSSCFINHSLI